MRRTSRHYEPGTPAGRHCSRLDKRHSDSGSCGSRLPCHAKRLREARQTGLASQRFSLRRTARPLSCLQTLLHFPACNYASSTPSALSGILGLLGISAARAATHQHEAAEKAAPERSAASARRDRDIALIWWHARSRLFGASGWAPRTCRASILAATALFQRAIRSSQLIAAAVTRLESGRR
jgi:hypothetical protein